MSPNWTQLGIYFNLLVSSNAQFVPITDVNPWIPSILVEEQRMDNNKKKTNKVAQIMKTKG